MTYMVIKLRNKFHYTSGINSMPELKKLFNKKKIFTATILNLI